MRPVVDTERFDLGPFPLAVYGWMFAGTLGGQLVGIVATTAARAHLVWVPALCSVLLEAVVGVRYGTPIDGHALTRGDCGRLSAYYSTGLGILTIPLLVWTAAARSPGSPFGGFDANLVVLLAIAAFAGLAVVRWGLMSVLLQRRV